MYIYREREIASSYFYVYIYIYTHTDHYIIYTERTYACTHVYIYLYTRVYVVYIYMCMQDAYVQSLSLVQARHRRISTRLPHDRVRAQSVQCGSSVAARTTDVVKAAQCAE